MQDFNRQTPETNFSMQRLGIIAQPAPDDPREAWAS
jgi:hypothetical protein